MYGALTLPDTDVGFDREGSAMVPITSGNNKLGTIELKSPLDSLKETFSNMKESLLNMVGLQTEQAKREELEAKRQEFIASGMQGATVGPNDDLAGVDTDDRTYGNFVEKAEGVSGNILDSIKDAFDQTSFGEKMMAVILAGGFLLFSKYSETIEKYLEPIIKFLMDTIDFLGPEGAFFAFLGGFILLKSGLAKKGIMKAGSLILKTIKASAASLDRQGGLFKAMGNGFEAINKGAKSLVGQLSKMGSTITGGLTKGFTMLGRGLTSLRIGIMSMSSSLGAMIVPFLPVIAIAAAVVAVFYSLKSGFDTFKQSLDDGDSMFTAVLKGLGDAMLTLVTLPYVLVQKLVGFIAGLFGFDNFKEKLESFSIKDKIVEVFSSLTSGMVNIIKAIAKGAAAAIAAALPGGETPQEAFAKAYAEVMAGGEGESAALQGTPDFQGDQSQKDFNDDSAERDKVKGYNNMDTSEMNMMDAIPGSGTGNATAISYYKKQEDERRYRDLGEGTRDFNTLTFDEYLKLNNITQSPTAESGIDVQSKEFEAKLERKTVMKEGKVVSDEVKTTVIQGGNVQGDTINQMSETNITGDLQVNNTEYTQKILQEHF